MSDQEIEHPGEWERSQIAQYEATDGREGYLIFGYPCVIITFRGRKTGAIRKTPLIRVVHDGHYILVASIGGRPRDPQWAHNLRANPAITLQDRAERHDLVTREVTDPAERAAIWKTCVAIYPDYAKYQERTERVIPIFVTTPKVHNGDSAAG